MPEEPKPASDREIFASLRTELRRIARAKMRFERPDHTLQPTALVNEAFIKLFKTPVSSDFWEDSSKALRLIANAMEQILNDHADAYNARKRGGAQKQRVPIDELQAQEFGEGYLKVRIDSELQVKSQQCEKVLAVRKVLELLRKDSPREARVLQLRFYCGLTEEEIAAVLGVSLETVKLDVRKAKVFMKAHLVSRTD
jgi:RNA polymerase sigma-70 factor (ECF subfamily)